MEGNINIAYSRMLPDNPLFTKYFCQTKGRFMPVKGTLGSALVMIIRETRN